MVIMNTTYNPHGIFFHELGRTWTINKGWTEAVYDRELEWKKQIRKGDYKTLNLYYIKGLGTLGRCYNPETAAPNANKTAIDGCMIQPETAPGGPLKYESKGKTTVHEVGHWFGLYHPWESHGNKITDQDGDGCYGLGDKVADTGAMSWRLLGAACLHANGTEKTQQDTCKKVCDVETRKVCVDDPLKDPVDNIMGYCPDDMLRVFTDGQVDRMFTIWDEYRKDKSS
jgi:hypothetical protein